MAAHDFADGWQGALKPPNGTPGTQTPTPGSGTRTPTRNGIVIFSGGSAANSLVDLFNQVRAANNTTLSYIIPISDNGGSSSELIRVFGGPGAQHRSRDL